MNITEIVDAIENVIVARNCFIVEIKISKENDVEIMIESNKGIIEIADCEEVSRAFEAAFDREKEDYSITVSSAGLDQPFKVFQQFEKAIGSLVEVSFKGGKKLTARLVAATPEQIQLNYSVKEAVEGKKKKVLVEHTDSFNMEQINAVYPHIVFE